MIDEELKSKASFQAMMDQFWASAENEDKTRFEALHSAARLAFINEGTLHISGDAIIALGRVTSLVLAELAFREKYGV